MAIALYRGSSICGGCGICWQWLIMPGVGKGCSMGWRERTASLLTGLHLVHATMPLIHGWKSQQPHEHRQDACASSTGPALPSWSSSMLTQAP